MTKRRERIWIGALALAFLAGLTAGLPARLALRLVPDPLASRLSEVEGTLWRGQASLALAGLEPAEIGWRLAPSSLLIATPRVTLDVVHPLGRYDGIAVLHDGTVEVADGSLSTTLSPLARVAGLAPGTLLGSVEVRNIRHISRVLIAVEDVDVVVTDAPSSRRSYRSIRRD